jgi:hypothetical protein
MSVGNRVLQMFSVVHIALFQLLNLPHFYISTFHSVCVQCPIWLFSVFPWLRAFPVRCTGIFWMILRWFQFIIIIIIIIISE